MQMSSTELLAYEFFCQLKWPNGFVCPRCGFKGAYTVHTRRLPLYQCQQCRHQTTLTAGTILANSRTPLHKWKMAIELMSQPNSVNAVQLSSILEVTYKTAFSMLKKIRMALTEFDRDIRLSGSVHAGITYFNQSYDTIVRRKAVRLPAVIGGSFDSEGNIRHLKIKPAIGYEVARKDVYKELVQVGPHCVAFQYLQRCRLKDIPVFPMLTRRLRDWMNGAFRGVSRRYLEHYFDEYTFRVNRNFESQDTLTDLGLVLMNNAAAIQPKKIPVSTLLQFQTSHPRFMQRIRANFRSIGSPA